MGRGLAPVLGVSAPAGSRCRDWGRWLCPAAPCPPAAPCVVPGRAAQQRPYYFPSFRREGGRREGWYQSAGCGIGDLGLEAAGEQGAGPAGDTQHFLPGTDRCGYLYLALTFPSPSRNPSPAVPSAGAGKGPAGLGEDSWELGAGAVALRHVTNGERVGSAPKSLHRALGLGARDSFHLWVPGWSRGCERGKGRQGWEC